MASLDTGLSLDLSRLPPPQVLRPLDFETILAERLADFQVRYPQFDALLESDPALKLQEVDAWRELLLRGQINDSARAVMLAFASGADLDNIGARSGVQRRIIREATNTEQALFESDAELRSRIQSAPESLPHAGFTGAFYRNHALAAVPALKDVRAFNRGQGRVDIILLAREGSGVVSQAQVAQVAALFNDEQLVQLTDVISVRSVTTLAYSINLQITVRRGPDPIAVKASTEAAVRAYAASRHRIGEPIYVQMLAAAAAVGGVEQVHLAMPTENIDPGNTGVAWMENLTVTVLVEE